MDGLIPLGILLAVALVGVAFICLGFGESEWREEQNSYSGPCKVKRTKHNDGLMLLGNVLLWPSLVLFFVYLIVFLALFLTSFGDVKAMEAFYRDTLANYEYTVSATEQIEISAYSSQDGVLTDLAYQQQGLAASDRIKEMRDKTEWYNRTLRRLNSLNGVPVGGWLFHDVPNDLKPIVLTGQEPTS